MGLDNEYHYDLITILKILQYPRTVNFGTMQVHVHQEPISKLRSLLLGSWYTYPWTVSDVPWIWSLHTTSILRIVP